MLWFFLTSTFTSQYLWNRAQSLTGKAGRKAGGMQKEHQSPGGAQGTWDPSRHLPTAHGMRKPFPVPVSFLYCSDFTHVPYPVHPGFSARDENKLISGCEVKGRPHREWLQEDFSPISKWEIPLPRFHWIVLTAFSFLPFFQVVALLHHLWCSAQPPLPDFRVYLNK